MSSPPKVRHVLISLVVVIGTVALGAPLAGAAKDDIVLVSRQSASDGGVSGDSSSRSASISAGGRHVAFVSSANNLSDRDTDATNDVYVRDVQANTTSLVSRQSASDGGAGADAEPSSSPEISHDGRYVVFGSAANNLAGGDTESDQDVFVRDTQTNTTALVSRQSASAGNAPGDQRSTNPSISADGRYVVFSSAANNFVTGENEAVDNIFLRDTQAETTTLVSRRSASDGGAAADAFSYSPSISADGRYVAFESDANNLVSGENEAFNNIFIRDTQAQTTTLVTRQSASDGNAGADDHSYGASISADGRYVAFETYANNLVAGEDEGFNVFVRDTHTETTTLVSRQSASDGAAPGDDESFGAAISGNGRYVAFESLANNFASGEQEEGVNIFVRDTLGETTSLMSRQSATDGSAPADGRSDDASISPDGRWVGFQTNAENLSALDSGGYTDVFIYDYLGEPPSTTDTTAPGLGASTAKSKQKLGKALKVTAITNEDAAVAATATATPKGQAKRARKLKFKSASAQATAGTPVTLKLKPSKKTARKLKAARSAKAQIKLSAADAAGNTATETFKVKLR